MITTTLNRIRAHNPCSSGWAKLLRHLGKKQPDDEPIPFAVILESNGIDDALWCCRAEPELEKEWRLFAVWCARQVQHLMQDPRSIAALDVAEQFTKGSATTDELDAARAAACAAAWATAWDAACAAAWAAAWDAAWDATWDAARDAQAAAFLQLVTDGTLPTTP